MEKPALRNNRYENINFTETNWTKSSKNLGEYIFRRISLDQSNKELQNIRPVHLMSKLIITGNEINNYVSDYLKMTEEKRNNSFAEKMTSKLNKSRSKIDIEIPEYLGHS